jgi:hypothetical protein
MSVLQLLVPLLGVVIGALLAPLTQLYLEKKREERAADRAKLLVAGELLHAQLALRAASKSQNWLYIEDANAALALLPSSEWEQNRASLIGHVDENLMDQLTMAYGALMLDRMRFVTASKLPGDKPLTPEEAQSLKAASDDLGRLRRQLGGGGSRWPDEMA